MMLEHLKPGTLFRFSGKKTVYRIIAASWLYVQYENPKREHSIWEIGYNQKRFHEPVTLIDNALK